MGRNAYTLRESKLSPEKSTEVIRAGLFHSSGRENRESIESRGLIASKPWDDEPAGVYLHVGKPYPAREDGTQDVYQVTPNPNLPVHEDTLEQGNVFIPRKVPISDFKRVGHFHRNADGHPEIHWHREEECPNG